MIGKIKYAPYGVKLNAQNFILSFEYPHRDVCTTYHLRHWWHRWGEMQQQVYQVDDVDETKQCLIDVWHGFQQSVINLWKYFEHLIECHIMHILFCLSYLLILWTLNKSYCIKCSRILPVSVFCVFQGSGVTPLKCGMIYDMDFVANFIENTTVKISQHVKLMNECILAQFLLRYGVYLLMPVFDSKWASHIVISMEVALLLL